MLRITKIHLGYPSGGRHGEEVDYTKSLVISPNFRVSYSLANMAFRVIFGVIDEIEESIGRGSLLEDLRMSELPTLHAICTDLIKLLVKSISKYNSQVSFI